MASLTNQKISNSYLGLLNTTSNGVLTSALAQITDGNGNGSPIYLSTAALNLYNKYTFPDAVPASGTFLKATDSSGTLEWVAESGGTVNISGTPSANQIAIWTDATTIKGMSTLTIDTNGKITITQGTNNYIIGGGNLASNSGTGNVGLGHNVLVSQTSGNDNVAIGKNVLDAFLTGDDNVAIGNNAMGTATGGSNNVAIGKTALQNNTGSTNTAIGNGSMASGSFSGLQNTCVGATSGNALTTGGANVFIGNGSGSLVTTLSNNVILGGNSGSTLSGNNNIIISDGGGNARIQVDSSGNVGIASGTTSLVYPLEVHSADNGDAIVYNDTAQSIKNWLGAFSGAAVIGAITNHPLALYAGTAERVRISSGTTVSVSNPSSSTGSAAAGRLADSSVHLIDTTDVGRYSQITFGYPTNNTYASAYIGYVSTSNSASGKGDLVFGTKDNTAYDIQPTERVRISSGGNLGLGATSPSAKIQIQTATNAGGAEVAAFLVNKSTTNNTEVRLAFAAHTNDDISTDRYSYIAARNNGGSNGQDLVFATNSAGAAGTVKLTIESNGAATFTSSVIGQRLFSGDGGTTTNPMIANALDQDTGIFFPAANTMAFSAGGTEVFRIKSGSLYNDATGITKLGNLGDFEFIDTFFSGTRRLRPANDNNTNLGDSSHRFDDIFATNNVIQTSDKNEKNTIKESDLGLDFVKKLLPKSYKFNNKTRTHYGLISQDVEDLLSDISKDTEDFAGFIKSPKDIDDPNNTEFVYGLRYNEFIAPMIKAIQEQQLIIEDLKSRIEKLEL